MRCPEKVLWPDWLPEPRECVPCVIWAGTASPGRLLLSQTPLEGTAHLPLKTARLLLPSLISELGSQTDCSLWEMDWVLLPEVWMDSQASLVLCSPHNRNVNISDKRCCSTREPDVFPMYLFCLPASCEGKNPGCWESNLLQWWVVCKWRLWLHWYWMGPAQT